MTLSTQFAEEPVAAVILNRLSLFSEPSLPPKRWLTYLHRKVFLRFHDASRG